MTTPDDKLTPRQKGLALKVRALRNGAVVLCIVLTGAACVAMTRLQGFTGISACASLLGLAVLLPHWLLDLHNVALIDLVMDIGKENMTRVIETVVAAKRAQDEEKRS